MKKEMNNTTPVPVFVSWSSGKDSAWALHTLRQQSECYDVRGIFTTVTKTFDRVSIHSTPAWVLKQQAKKLGVPLYEIPIKLSREILFLRKTAITRSIQASILHRLTSMPT